MAVNVRVPGRADATPRTYEAADDFEVDEIGTLILTSGAGRQETTVAVFAAQAWISAEQA